MAYKGVMDDVRKCIALQKPNRLPAFAMSEEFDVRMAGVTYNDYNRDAKLLAKCQSDVIKRFDYDWAWLQIDDCIEFEILGVGVKYEGMSESLDKMRIDLHDKNLDGWELDELCFKPTPMCRYCCFERMLLPEWKTGRICNFELEDFVLM